MNSVLRTLFFALVVRPLVYLGLGLNVRHGGRLPKKGPAILVANHNSHLDTLVLISLFPLRELKRIRPVAAMDYFLKNRALAWFALKIIGILPLDRQVRASKGDPLAGCSEALERGDLLILFPEGSRGDPESLSEFKTGIAHLAKRHPDVPVTPLFLHGLGKALPKGDWVPVPFFCDVFVGEVVPWEGNRKEFMTELEGSVTGLAEEGTFGEWL